MRHLARSAAILPTAILLITSVAFAQRATGGGGVSSIGRYAISGTVADDSQHSPIEGAQLRLSTSSGEMMESISSNSNGKFAFNNLVLGLYKITITAKGYEPGQQDISMLTAAVEDLRLTLRKVAASRSESGAKDEVISARELSLPSKAQEALAKGRERLYQKHDPAGSLPFFHKVNEMAPSFFEAYYDEGVAYTLQGQNGEAESSFRKAIATSQDHYSDPCFALASLLTDEKQFAEAERLARRGIEIQPDAWRGHYELARALLGEGRLMEAEKSGMEARKRKEDFPGLYLILANIHLQLHNNEGVLEDVNTFLKLEPSGPNSDQARAIKGQMERALGKSPGSEPLR